MNNNIIRSYMYHAGFMNDDGGWDNRPLFEQEDNFKRFAELIVRECMDVVEKQLGGGNGDGVEWDRAIDFTYEDMKKHFGVEE